MCWVFIARNVSSQHRDGVTTDLILLNMKNNTFHYIDVIMIAMTSQITSLTIVYSTAYSGVDQRKHQSYASLAFVRGIHRWPVNSPHKGPVTRKMFPFDDDMSSDFHHNSSESVVVLVVTQVKQFYFILNVCKFFNSFLSTILSALNVPHFEVHTEKSTYNYLKNLARI